MTTKRFLPLAALLLVASAHADQSYMRQYGTASTIRFKLWDTDATPLTGAADDGDDLQLDVGCTGSFADSTNDFAEVGGGVYEVDLTSGELTTDELCASVDSDSDDVNTDDEPFTVETFGNASAMHPTLGWNTGDAYSYLGTNLGSAGASATEAGGTGDQFTYILDKLLAYMQLSLRSDASIATDRATELSEINANEGTGAGDYVGSRSQENISATQGTIIGYVDELESRLTAARAGYLDNLNIGENVAGTSEISGLNDPTAAAIVAALLGESCSAPVAGTIEEQLCTDIDAVLLDTNELQTDDVPGLIAALGTPLDAAGVRAALGLASANLDTQLSQIFSAVPTLFEGTIATVTNQTTLITTEDPGVDLFHVNRLVCVEDANVADVEDCAWVNNYDQATQTWTLSNALRFTVEVGDTLRIYPIQRTF